MDLYDLQRDLADFADRRDWQQFHTPKNLAMALAGEVGELLEIFQWLTPEEAATVMDSRSHRQAVCGELADVFAYLLRLADILGVDLVDALQAKMRLNEHRYPEHLARGRADKHTFL